GTQLGAPRLVGDAVWWTEGIATEGGRQAIVRTAGPVPRATAGGSADGDDPAPAETVTVLPAPYNARSRVHEYGGASWTVVPEPHSSPADDPGPLVVFGGLGDPPLPAPPLG